MAKIESIAFSFGLLMAGLLVLSSIAPLGAPAQRDRSDTDVAGLAIPRAA